MVYNWLTSQVIRIRWHPLYPMALAKLPSNRRMRSMMRSSKKILSISTHGYSYSRSLTQRYAGEISFHTYPMIFFVSNSLPWPGTLLCRHITDSWTNFHYVLAIGIKYAKPTCSTNARAHWSLFQYAQYEYSLGEKNAEEIPLIDSAEAIENAKKVYERGIVAVRYSVDMWVKYVDFLIQTLNVSAEEARAYVLQNQFD